MFTCGKCGKPIPKVEGTCLIIRLDPYQYLHDKRSCFDPEEATDKIAFVSNQGGKWDLVPQEYYKRPRKR